MKTLLKALVLVTSLFVLAAPAFAGKKDPVAVLSQVTGEVEYNKGKKWKKVRRNKFLFSGYTIRSGADGKGMLTNKKTGEVFKVGPGMELKVTSKGVKATKGKLVAAKKTSKLAASLMKKFDKSQKFTTVRRSHKKSKLKIDGVKDIVVFADYPYMVWENPGKGYSFKLTVGDQTYEVAATDAQVVRTKIKPFEGTLTYKIDVYKKGKLKLAMKQYKKKGKKMDRTVTWLKGSAKSQIDDSVAALQQEYPDNLFMLGNYYEDQKMFVAAMEQYRQYLADNPDEIEMAPYLFRVYKKLKLNKVYKVELEEYKQKLLE